MSEVKSDYFTSFTQFLMRRQDGFKQVGGRRLKGVRQKKKKNITLFVRDEDRF